MTFLVPTILAKNVRDGTQNGLDSGHVYFTHR